jgi:threonine aldolase
MELDPTTIRASCKKFLSYDYPLSAKESIQRIADYASPDMVNDEFGHGKLFDMLENKLTEITGMEAAAFMPTGRMAQLIGLQIWCQKSANYKVAMHPRCHMEESESKAYAISYKLQAIPLGDASRVVAASDMAALTESVGAISLELPLLALGCRLPSWSDLTGISEQARERGIPLHVDAARLWESQPYYNKSFDEISALFDSLYVSVYKGLSAISGGALLGPRDLIEDAKLSQFRLGGTPRILAPYLIDSLRALEHNLPLMPLFYKKALALAEAFGKIAGIWVSPNPPYTNTFLVAVRGKQEFLKRAALEIASETGIWLVDFERLSNIDGMAQFQIVVGEATLDLEIDEVVNALSMLANKLSGYGY